MKANFSSSRLAVIGIAYLVSLAAAFALVPPEVAQYDVVAPLASAASLMLFFGPYLLAAGCTTGFLPEPSSLYGLAAVIPFYVAHVVFLSVLSKRTSLWRRFGRIGERMRKSAVIMMSLISAASVWYELPCVTQYDLTVDEGKVPTDNIRLAVVSDLHSCRYGAGQKALIKAVQSQKPDIVLLAGDIFDDRLPDDNAKAFFSAIAKDFPCFYVFGNHEHWSERIPEMRDALVSANVTVLEGNVKTIRTKGAEIDICGIDDPTYMSDDAWLGQLAAVAAETASSPRLKILLSHRPEYSGAYAKYDFDLVFSGHLHGGQWGIPGMGLGVCGPSSGGPSSGDRPLFPKRAGGAYLIGSNTTLVVSRGLARESTPLPRFFNHPEIVIVNLKPHKQLNSAPPRQDGTCQTCLK